MYCKKDDNRNKMEKQLKFQFFDNQLWTYKETAHYLNVPVPTLKDWVYKRRIKFVKVGKHIRFRPSDVEKWLEEGGRHVNL